MLDAESRVPGEERGPGPAITVAGLSLNLLGDGLRETLDPRLRGLDRSR